MDGKLSRVARFDSGVGHFVDRNEQDEEVPFNITIFIYALTSVVIIVGLLICICVLVKYRQSLTSKVKLMTVKFKVVIFGKTRDGTDLEFVNSPKVFQNRSNMKPTQDPRPLNSCENEIAECTSMLPDGGSGSPV